MLPDVRVATWNIHGGVGLDRRYRPQRIARVIAALDADIVALQEVELGAAHVDLMAALRGCGDYACHGAPAMREGERAFGNALLTRLRVAELRHVDLSRPGREGRAAIDADLHHPELGTLRVFVTHLGLRGSERAVQLARMRAMIDASERPTLLLGDFNEWRARTARLQGLAPVLHFAPARATCPSLWPLLALDRMAVSAPLVLRDLRVIGAGEARTASDHLPLIARLSLA